MNSVSVTGKNWILKNFDQEQIVFIKGGLKCIQIFG